MSFTRPPINTLALQRSSYFTRPIASSACLHAPSAASNGHGATYGGTTRYGMFTNNNGCVDLQVVFQNWISNEGATGATEKTAGLSPVSFLNVFIEYNGTTYQCLLNGANTFTLSPGATIVMDILELAIPPNTQFFVRYCITFPNGGFIPNMSTWQNSSNNYWQNYSTTITDITSSTGTGGLSQAAVYMTPTCILGAPPATTPVQPIAGVVGDSIYDGVFTADNYSSHPMVALNSNNIMSTKGAIPSETGTSFNLDVNSTRRMQLLSLCDVIFTNYGTNDIYLSPPTLSFAQMQTMLLQLWTKLYRLRAARIVQDTILPRCTNNTTPASAQAVISAPFEAIRQSVNAWLRAPISAGPGASALYDAKGILARVIDSASYVETDTTNAVPGGPTAPNLGGRWYCGVANNANMSQDGVHPNITTYPYLAKFISVDIVGTFTIDSGSIT